MHGQVRTAAIQAACCAGPVLCGLPDGLSLAAEQDPTNGHAPVRQMGTCQDFVPI
jgi:hypothetical protein